MRMRSVELFLCCVSFLMSLAAYASPEYLHRSSSSSSRVRCIDLSRMTADERLMTLSLQGLVNRGTPEIYTYSGMDRRLLQFYKSRKYITKSVEYKDCFALAEKYRNYCTSAVVCNPDDFLSVNLALNISGVSGRIVITDRIRDKFIFATGCSDILDIRGLNLSSPADYFRWYRKNILPCQSLKMLSVAKGGNFMYDVFMDYCVEFKVPVFWLPGKMDSDYDAEYEAEVLDFLEEMPVNVPVLGFWQGEEKGHQIGYSEYDGVKLAGKYGKFTIVNTWVGNYSWHSGVRVKADASDAVKVLRSGELFFRQKHIPHQKTDGEEKYIALVMIESGDAPCYFLYNGFSRQWNDPMRGQVPLSYGLTPALRFLAPAVAAEIYRTRTDNDYFFCSISGAGYCYPFEDYGTMTVDRDSCLHGYFSDITYPNMAAMDFDVLGVYTHSGALKWSESDYDIAKRHISEIPGLRTIVAGMHRTGYKGADANFVIGDVTVFNTVTFWPERNLEWDNTVYDDEAVDFMVNELKTNAGNSKFVQAMFYSWYYTPSRLYRVMKILEDEGWTFVTISQLDELYRSSLK